MKSRLGKGLDALIPEDFDSSLLVGVGERIEQIAVNKLSPNPAQPRQSFDEASLKALAQSIKQYGIVQPLVVTPIKTGYQIVAGERRWRSAKLAGLKTVPALVRTIKELEQLEIALVENVQRVDLSPLEQAVSIEKLHHQFNSSYADIAKRLGKAVSTISNIARLLQLPEEAKTDLANGIITEGHARQVLALAPDKAKQLELLGLIKKNAWSVRQTENYVTAVKNGAKEAKSAVARIAPETAETKLLSKRYGAAVRIRHSAKGGRVEISFDSEEQLKKLLDFLAR